MAKPVQLRKIAAEDVEAATEHHRQEAGDTVAGRFVDAVERAVTHIGRHPHNGSLRFSYELGIPELRAWPITRFPYLVFYVERDNAIEVWRLLHTRRDIPATLTRDE